MNTPRPFVFDARRKVAFPGNNDKSVLWAVEHFIKCAQDAIESHGSFFVALSGGSTPKKIFTLLASPKFNQTIDWSKVFLFWSDERSVGPEDSDSNYKMAMDSGFRSLPVPKDQIFRMEAESEIDANATAYEETINKVLQGRSLDLVMLGMGDDGHTASLFPSTKGLDISNRLVIPNEVPQHSTWRMTFTYPMINSAHNIAIYVMGTNKHDRIDAVLRDASNTFPSGRVGTASNPALWIIDDEASSTLLKHWQPAHNNRNTG